jgi:AhpD family alkylhydroperoxidase
MDARMDLFTNSLAGTVVKHLAAAGRAAGGGGLSDTTRELVLLRVSQINGCGFCVDMHSKDAVYAGESAQRLLLVGAWREATVFSDAERAALELAEEGTRIADASGGVSDDVWANAAKYFDEEQLAALVSTIAVINAFNRLNVMTRQLAGAYQAGQYA